MGGEIKKGAGEEKDRDKDELTKKEIRISSNETHTRGYCLTLVYLNIHLNIHLNLIYLVLRQK